MIKERLLKKEIYKGKQGKILSIITSLLIIFLLTGCNKVLSIDEFSNVMSDKKFTVADLSDNDKKMAIAVSSHYQIYFYQFDNSVKTDEAYNDEIKNYSSMKIHTGKKCVMHEDNSNDVYTIYVKKNNTYLSASAVKNYKKDIIEVLDSIGYYCQ